MLGKEGVRCVSGSVSSRHCGDDRDLVSGLERCTCALKKSNVLVVYVHIQESAEGAVVFAQPSLETAVLVLQAIQHLLDSRRLNPQVSPPIGQSPKWCRNANDHAHGRTPLRAAGRRPPQPPPPAMSTLTGPAQHRVQTLADPPIGDLPGRVNQMAVVGFCRREGLRGPLRQVCPQRLNYSAAQGIKL